MPASAEAKWHWGEGIKFAHELLKSLLIINGAAAIAMLTFIGNVRLLNGQIVLGMVSFGLGVVAAVVAMFGAYLTQLHYGNAEVVQTDTKIWGRASTFHSVTYVAGLLAILLFCAGIGFVGWGAYAASFESIASTEAVNVAAAQEPPK